MSNIGNELDLANSRALVRYMLYTDVNRRRATQVGEDTWMDYEVICSGKYDYATKHELIFRELDDEPGQYIVAMVPYIRQISHPTKAGVTIPLRLVYITSEALWPFFDPIEEEPLDRAMLPE
ncbi:hypothetical protein [Spirosoma pollinicola]|uniref:Uncharacterized protein n=1 Tax=Spirosoma pollinicola TaxID=2057025 RepID=A0A2K8YTF0_9BACT|nr:hypothetical protein [Spirosoma pollinicola]AUD00848.1 hypothetical protein CWM47_02870 [Spirosoma pollinicola]